MIDRLLTIERNINFLQCTWVTRSPNIVVGVWVLVEYRALGHGASALGMYSSLVEVLTVVSLKYTLLKLT
jgi:hypothetical protein